MAQRHRDGSLAALQTTHTYTSVLGSIGADVMITDPTAPSYVERGWDESRLLRECERARQPVRAGEACVEWSYHDSFGYDHFWLVRSIC